jgi:hypothetical protein
MANGFMLAVLRRLIVGFVGGGCQGCVGSEMSDGRSVCEVAGVFDENTDLRCRRVQTGIFLFVSLWQDKERIPHVSLPPWMAAVLEGPPRMPSIEMTPGACPMQVPRQAADSQHSQSGLVRPAATEAGGKPNCLV